MQWFVAMSFQNGLTVLGKWRGNMPSGRFRPNDSSAPGDQSVRHHVLSLCRLRSTSSVLQSGRNAIHLRGECYEPGIDCMLISLDPSLDGIKSAMKLIRLLNHPPIEVFDVCPLSSGNPRYICSVSLHSCGTNPARRRFGLMADTEVDAEVDPAAIACSKVEY